MPTVLVGEQWEGSMSPRQTAERARTRYAHAIYRTALLRDPQPGRAADAVVAAFSSIDWASTALGEQIEARLVAALPPLKKFGNWRSRPLAPLPAAFWKLSPQSRVALGLYLLRGMATPLVAIALARPLAEAQTLVLDGIGRLSGERPDALPEECRRCRLLRLDDPFAERAHVLACDRCRTEIERWEQAASNLTAQLARAVGSQNLPRPVDEALSGLLVNEAVPPRVSSWRSPLLWQTSLVLLVLLLFLGLWAGGSMRSERDMPATGSKIESAGGATPAQTPRQRVEAARAAYLQVPQGDGIVHRSWEWTLDGPDVRFQADEWIDPSDPARHRMQVMRGQAVREWQVGDGESYLHYAGNISRWVCGPISSGEDRYGSQINVWQTSVIEQRSLRQARWQTARWSLGLRYLDIALQADALRSLGIAGSGDQAVLTLAAEDLSINGTLLLRLDSNTNELHEVRGLRANNGQTEARTYWKTVSMEVIPRDVAEQQGILMAYPGTVRPPQIIRTSPILDPACPLVAPEHTLSLPYVLALGLPLVGLPTMPPEIESAMVVSGAARGLAQRERIPTDEQPLHVVYLGPGKRLVFGSGPAMNLDEGPTVTAGPWAVQLEEVALGVWSGQMSLRSVASDELRVPSKPVSVWADGWTHQELLELLGTARVLNLNDWADAPDRFWEPIALDADTRARLIRIVAANIPRLPSALHQVTLTMVRQAPFAALLADPYHRPAPPMPLHAEHWLQWDDRGNLERMQLLVTDRTGELVRVRQLVNPSLYDYAADNNLLYISPRQPPQVQLPAAKALAALLETKWIWTTTSEGNDVASHTLPFTNSTTSASVSSQLAENWGYDPWVNDLDPAYRTFRYEFDADGLLLRSETLAILHVPPVADEAARYLATLPRGKSVVLQSTEFVTRSWHSSLPDNAFTWSTPTNAIAIDTATRRRSAPFSNRSVRTPAQAAARVPWPVWNWQDGANVPVFQRARVAFSPNTGLPSDRTLNINQASSLGAAVEMHYSTSEGSLHVIQGPAPILRQLLRQTAPRWTTSEKHSVVIRGKAREAWLMRSGDMNEYWTVIELGQVLLFFHYHGPLSGAVTLIEQLDDLHIVEPDLEMGEYR